MKLNNREGIELFKKLVFILLLLSFDILAIYSSLIFHKFISNPFTISFLGELPAFIFSTFPFLAFLIPLLAYQDLYTKRFPLWDEIKRITKIVFIVFIVVITIIVSQKQLYSVVSIRSLILLGFISILFLTLYRFIGKRFLYSIGIGKDRVIIICAGEAGFSVLKGIEGERYLGYEVVGFLDDDPEKKGQYIDGKKIFGDVRHLPKFTERLWIDTIIIALPSLLVEDLSQIVSSVQRYAKRVLLIPNLRGIALLNAELSHLFMQRLFLLNIKNNLKSPFNKVIKRVFDVIVSLAMLPVLLLIIGIIGFLIKIDSPGPVLYSHKRIGKDGKIIKVAKFRSMYIDSKERLATILRTDADAAREWETYFKLKNDPRVTKVGQFLRKTSLDELPQIFNVLKGEMSLVGPRPVVQEEIDKYYKDYAEYYFMVPPGITGLWQVSGRNNTDYDFRVKLDTWYVLNWSVWLDIVLMFKTVKVVLKREGAY